MKSKTPRTRKEIAKTFLRQVATGKVGVAYDSFVGPGFRHHNPYYRGDAASLRKGMEEAHAQFPHTGIEIQRALEDGNLVAVHSRVKHQPSDVGFAVVHVFRFKGSKIVEFWDVGMEVPADSPNEYGAF